VSFSRNLLLGKTGGKAILKTKKNILKANIDAKAPAEESKAFFQQGANDKVYVVKNSKQLSESVNGESAIELCSLR
jgi:hypothetical protein